MAFGAADDARAWLRPLFDRITDLAADERVVIAEALALAVPGIGAEWLPRLESACSALPRDGGVALATGCALAERGLWGKARTLLELAAEDATLAVLPRRRARIALAELATREGDAARAATAYEAAARLG
jgi:HemY protein